MTITARIYIGPLQRGSVALPGRLVSFGAGDTVEFSGAEAALLDPSEWSSVGIADDFIAGATVAEVLAAVQDRPELARHALVLERAGKNRKTLVDPLIELIGTDPASAENKEA